MVRRCAAVFSPVILIRLHLDLGAAPETWGPFLRNALVPPMRWLEGLQSAVTARVSYTPHPTGD